MDQNIQQPQQQPVQTLDPSPTSTQPTISPEPQKKSNKKKVLIIVGILAAALLVGLASYYLYTKSQDSNIDEQTNDTPQTAAQTEEEPAAVVNEDETKNWARLTSLNNKFSFAVPDGWIVTNDTQMDYVSATGVANLTYKAGTKATINNQVGFRGGGGHTVSNFFAQSGGTDLAGYYNYFTPAGTVQTDSGLSVSKFTRVSPGEEMDAPKGSISTGYMAKKGDLIVTLTYTQVPGESDQASYVEKAAKTLQL